MRRFLFTLFIAVSTAVWSMAGGVEEKEKGVSMVEDMSFFREKPSFLLNIKCNQIGFTIYLNGIELIDDNSGLPVELDYPVNDTILDGDNELAVLINEKSPKNGKCKVDLIVREFDNFEMEPLKILTLNYDRSLEHPTDGTTPMGFYDSSIGFEPVKEGDIEVGSVVAEPHKKSAIYLSDFTIYRLPFSVPTPFGRWKYSQGDPILSKPYIDLSIEEAKDLQKNDPKLAKLYEINHKIYRLVEAKDIDGLVTYFKERNSEIDRAYFDPPGSTDKLLKERLGRTINDPDMELMKISDEEWRNRDIVFRVDDNNKLAWLTDLIIFNYTKGKGSRSYKMKFRWIESEQRWVLTR